MKEKLQLFCLPYAGGTVDVFDGLAKLLENEILVSPVEYAGHGSRKTEPFYQDFAELSKDVYEKISSMRRHELPYAIFGYSMGSIAVYELLCRYLKEELPQYIFLAAHEAPDVEWESKKYAAYDDEHFMDELIAFGGFEEANRKLLNNRFFRKLYFQPIREDYRLLAEYQFQDRQLLPADTTIFYAPKDISEKEIKSWQSFAGGSMEFIPLGSNHFFIREHAEEMAEIMRNRCLKNFT